MKSNKSRVLGLIGLSAKAGKIECGADAVKECVNKKKVKLVIVAEDASDRTKENFEFISNKQQILFVIYAKIDELSKAIGKNNKAVIAVKDKNLSEEIYKIVCGGEAIE